MRSGHLCFIISAFRRTKLKKITVPSGLSTFWLPTDPCCRTRTISSKTCHSPASPTAGFSFLFDSAELKKIEVRSNISRLLLT